MKAVFIFLFSAVITPSSVFPQTNNNLSTDPKWLAAKYGEWSGPGVTPRAGPMDSILLRNYAPASSIITSSTFVPRSKYAAIDVHTHNVATTPVQVSDWIRTMDEVGVETSVILTGAVRADFDRFVELYLKPYPGRFILFCGMDKTDIDKPDYPERVVAELARCYKMGARGVGEWTDKGLGYTMDSALSREKRLHPDDSRLDLFWEKCAELNMPVNIHVADHPSSWKALDVYQERTPEYQQFNQYGREGLSYEQLLSVRDRMLAKHPRTTFIACHLANEGNDLKRLGALLDKFSNLYLDISGRDYEIGRTPRAASKFFTKYQNRLLFGTDMGREKSMYQAWFRLLESEDEFMIGRIWWRYYGLGLPRQVLRKLYHSNARKVLNWNK